MSITLDLPPRVETLLRQRAEATGLEQGQFSSLDDFVAEQNQKYGLALES